MFLKKYLFVNLFKQGNGFPQNNFIIWFSNKIPSSNLKLAAIKII